MISIANLIIKHWWHRALVYIGLSIIELIFDRLLARLWFGQSGSTAILDGTASVSSLGLGNFIGYIVTMMVVIAWLTGWIYEYTVAHNSFLQAGQNALKKYGGYLIIIIICGLLIGVGLWLFYAPGIIMAVWLFMLPYYYARYNRISFNKSFKFGTKYFWPLLGLMIVLILVLGLIGLIPYLGLAVDVVLAGIIASSAAVIDDQWSTLSKRRSGITLNKQGD